ncbi:stimulated by retinoic acid gene 8 protein homolog [Ctenodactylus gundi]
MRGEPPKGALGLSAHAHPSWLTEGEANGKTVSVASLLLRVSKRHNITLRLIMETSEGDHNPSGTAIPQLLPQTQEIEPRVARRRLSQARHRATLIELFSNLKNTVYSHPELTATKWQVLNKTKSYILELEQTLDNLLKIQASLNLDDGNARSLEEVKEEYARIFCGNESLISQSILQNGSSCQDLPEAAGKNPEKKESENDLEEEVEEGEGKEKKMDPLCPPVTSLPDLLEFERYINFYKQVIELLVGNEIITLQEATHSSVSTAISHLWHRLSEEKKASVMQAQTQRYNNYLGLDPSSELVYPECNVKDSGLCSQVASYTVISTPQKILLEDALNAVTFLDRDKIPDISILSNIPEDTQDVFQPYGQIINFVENLLCNNIPVKEEPVPPVDDETVKLRCLETFDDDDF